MDNIYITKFSITIFRQGILHITSAVSPNTLKAGSKAVAPSAPGSGVTVAIRCTLIGVGVRGSQGEEGEGR